MTGRHSGVSRGPLRGFLEGAMTDRAQKQEPQAPRGPSSVWSPCRRELGTRSNCENSFGQPWNPLSPVSSRTEPVRGSRQRGRQKPGEWVALKGGKHRKDAEVGLPRVFRGHVCLLLLLIRHLCYECAGCEAQCRAAIFPFSRSPCCPTFKRAVGTHAPILSA